jgi:hypothetical protein
MQAFTVGGKDRKGRGFMSKSEDRHERTQLVQQDERASDMPVVLDDEGVPLPSDHANVIIRLEAGSTSGQDVPRSRWLRFLGYAPANSPLGRALSTVPLSILLSVVPFVMAAAAALFVKITWVTALALFVGFGAAVGFGWLQTRQRRVRPIPARKVIKRPVPIPRPEPASPAPLPEPETPAP